VLQLTNCSAAPRDNVAAQAQGESFPGIRHYFAHFKRCEREPGTTFRDNLFLCGQTFHGEVTHIGILFGSSSHNDSAIILGHKEKRLPMQAGDDRRIRTLIASARQAAARGRPNEADLLLRQAEIEAPRHPLVLNEAASRMLRSGNAGSAAALLKEVTDDQTDPEIWLNLARALRALGKIDDAASAVDRVLMFDPGHIPALLEKGSLQELREESRAAAMSYRTALQMIPSGFRSPPHLEPSLMRAREAVEANNRALESYLEDGIDELKAQFPDETFRRFDQCVDIILQKRRIARQQPTFMYFPELPAIEFYDRALFPWLDSIEAAADEIRAELLDVLSGGSSTLDPYVAIPKANAVNQWWELNHSRRWGVYSLWNEGRAFPDHIARCPRTVNALKVWPRWDVTGSGPTALFSVLDGRTRIPPHTGPVNTRLVVHLPLIVPPGCGFRVGGQQREWEPGKAFVFDDSIDHEAWNDSDVPRAVLIFDTWSPFLSEAERELVRALTTYIGEYYGTRSNSHAA
jgi:aspartate beta-hydroxylase